MAEQKDNKPSFTITYYGGDGRAGAIRAAAAMGGICYEENFITFSEQVETKKKGLRRWSGPPELVIYDKDGKELTKLAQSNACLRYVGNLAGLYPKEPVARALCDEILDSCEDLSNMLAQSFREKDKDKKKAMREALMVKDKLPYWMGKFADRLEENKARGNKNGFIVGDSMSIADLKLYFNLKGVVSGSLDYISAKALIDPQPVLKDYWNGIDNQEAMKKFCNTFSGFQKEYKEKQTKKFNYPGKFVCGSF